jgi:hypothetical protein
VSKNLIKQLQILEVFHFNRCLTAEYSETTAHFNGTLQQHTSTASSIRTNKYTYRSLSAQRLSERTQFILKLDARQR